MDVIETVTPLSEVESIPRYNYNKVSVKVRLLDLIQDAEGSCDGYELWHFDGWEEMFAEKTSDTGFGHLVHAMIENGFHPQSPIGYLPDQNYVTEGHHRLCAAILLGMEYVYISSDGGRLGGWADNATVNAHYDPDAFPIPVSLVTYTLV